MSPKMICKECGDSGAVTACRGENVDRDESLSVYREMIVC